MGLFVFSPQLVRFDALLVRYVQVPKGLAHIGPWDTLSELVVRINGLNPGMVSEKARFGDWWFQSISFNPLLTFIQMQMCEECLSLNSV